MKTLERRLLDFIATEANVLHGHQNNSILETLISKKQQLMALTKFVKLNQKSFKSILNSNLTSSPYMLIN